METPPPEDRSRFIGLRNAALMDLRSKSWELVKGENNDEINSRLSFLHDSDFDFKSAYGAAASNTPIAHTEILLGKNGVEYKVRALNFDPKQEESTVINVHTVVDRDEFGPRISKELYSFEHTPGTDIITVSLLSEDRRIPNPRKWVFRSN